MNLSSEDLKRAETDMRLDFAVVLSNHLAYICASKIHTSFPFTKTSCVQELCRKLSKVFPILSFLYA